MTLDEFINSVNSSEPHAGLTDELEALRIDACGDWNKAHQLVQSLDSSKAAWIHAYLHRKEGDIGNAGYWYRRAGRPVRNGDLEQEWREIATALLKDESER